MQGLPLLVSEENKKKVKRNKYYLLEIQTKKRIEGEPEPVFTRTNKQTEGAEEYIFIQTNGETDKQTGGDP